MTKEVAEKIVRGITDKIECNTVDIDDWAEFWGFTREEYEDFLDMAIKALEQELIAQERYEDLCEYFGNMKDILNSREDFKAWLARVKWHICKAEELYEKYEQKPCENAISRQAVLGCLTATKLKKFDFILQAREEIKKLPPVNPQPKTGHWIDIMVGDMPAQACDRCNTFYPLAYTGGGHNYCPNCGARMVESQERSE